MSSHLFTASLSQPKKTRSPTRPNARSVENSPLLLSMCVVERFAGTMALMWFKGLTTAHSDSAKPINARLTYDDHLQIKAPVEAPLANPYGPAGVGPHVS